MMTWYSRNSPASRNDIIFFKIVIFLMGRFLFRFSQIRRQLETLLAEKSRLATENSVYARENRFLREIVEYHQLTMQDIVYLDEGIEEVTEVGVPRVLSTSPSLTSLQSPPLETSPPLSRTSSKEIMSLPELHKPTITDASDSLTVSNGPVLTDSQGAQSNSTSPPLLTLKESTT